jgi:phosphate transport system permease protein
MTVAMVNIASAESLGETVAYESMFAIGLTLFAITLTMNYLADLISRQYREEY